MDGHAVVINPDLFDEEGYLRRYPDLAKAVAAGKHKTGWDHYLKHGAKEGRQPNDFNEQFYLRAYPTASLEIAAGRATSPLDHYKHIGKMRGFLPHPRAPRAKDPCAFPSEFGGLWVDLPHAEELIIGKLEVGLITQAQAELLRFFIKNGYVILPGALTPSVVAAARADLDKAFDNGFDDLRFECGAIGRGELVWQKELQEKPSKALDLHHFSPAMRAVMFCEKVSSFLGLIFESKAFASQTLTFLRGSAQEGHQDSAYVVYTTPRMFAASWAALEDVTLNAGELFYYPGSHKFPDFLFTGGYKSVNEARRMGAPEKVLNEEVRKQVKEIDQRAKDMGMEKAVFEAKAGDVLIWHADLVHGGSPVSTQVTRKSLVTHYCPKFAAPVAGEHKDMPVFDYQGHYWTTIHYPKLPRVP
jgi:hypothetical protein